MPENGKGNVGLRLISRKQACSLLGVSVRTLARIEASGALTKIKLTGKPNSMVRYELGNVLALVECGKPHSVARHTVELLELVERDGSNVLVTGDRDA